VPGLFVLGEANFSDHGANRLGASALMQGLADGYFVISHTLGDYIASTRLPAVDAKDPAFDEAARSSLDRITRLLSVKGNRSVQDLHRALGSIMWEKVGMARSREGLQEAISEIAALREEFWTNVKIPGSNDTLNKNLEFALRVADYMELGELMARDALQREESCGGHFRVEYQTEEGEAQRDDADFNFVGCWEHTGAQSEPVMHKEPLVFENVKPSQRSYK
jgi:succinate dehydrogenase / fumarate reductase flavoprotein subunit